MRSIPALGVEGDWQRRRDPGEGRELHCIGREAEAMGLLTSAGQIVLPDIAESMEKAA